MHDGTVRVRLSVEHMREEIVHALASREADIAKIAEAELDRALSCFDWEREIQALAQDVIRKSIADALESSFASWEFRQAAADELKAKIAGRLGAAMRREEKPWSAR